MTGITNGKFIYVFSEDSKDKLVAEKYHLLKADEHRKIYVFENKESLVFSRSDFLYILSDTLTF